MENSSSDLKSIFSMINSDIEKMSALVDNNLSGEQRDNPKDIANLILKNLELNAKDKKMYATYLAGKYLALEHQ